MTDRSSDQAPCALVDDDTFILMDAMHILEDDGFRVRDATNVADALAALAPLASDDLNAGGASD